MFKLMRNCNVPVIHEHVRFPDSTWRDSQILDSAEFRCVPPKIVIIPVL